MPSGEISIDQSTQTVQWWNILLIVIGVIIILLLVAVLRVTWSLMKDEEKETLPRLSDKEFGQALAAKVMGSDAVEQFQ